jgi:hypothetical protein
MFKEQELVLAQEIAGLAIWEWNAQSDEFTWLRGSTPLFGHPPEQLRTRADLLQCVMSEDRERIAQIRDEAVNAGGEYKAEYRVLSYGPTARYAGFERMAVTSNIPSVADCCSV